MSRKLVPFLFLSLPILMFVLWVVVPVVDSFIYSLTSRSSMIFHHPRYIGLGNYFDLFHDPRFLVSLENNLIWVLSFLVIAVPIGLAVALLFNRSFPGVRFYRAIYYVPMTLAYVVIGVIWAWIYAPQYGMLNSLLRALHLGFLAHQWIGDRRYMTGALVAVGVWHEVPYIMIVYLAGLQYVPQQLLEAAMLDGAGSLQRFRYVILPSLRPSTVIVVTVSIADSLRIFDVIYVMTDTHARAAEVLASYMYTQAFTYHNYGYGSAIAVVEFLIMVVFIVVYVNNVLNRSRSTQR